MGDAAATSAAASTASPAAAEAKRKADLLTEVGEVLTKHLGTDKAARGPAIRDAFGCSGREIPDLPVEQIAVGLATLKKTLEGLAAMRAALPQEPVREREPGEDDDAP